jgi:hypothetical protein
VYRGNEMKKIIMLLVIFLLLANSSSVSKARKNSGKTNKVSATKFETGTNNSRKEKKHKKYTGINCKLCHYYEYPTKSDPSLVNCPKDKMISIYHKPEEGPNVVVMNDMKGRYGPVIFTHRIHSEMSGMFGGCNNCHHYNTTGPVLKCKKCHSIVRKREDLSKPDIYAAYHRQCLNCHRQWNRTVDCNSCHQPGETDGKKVPAVLINQVAGKQHPEVPVPTKVVYETRYDKGKYVTFYHDDHTQTFGIECINCHKNENCIKCHDVKRMNGHKELAEQQKKISKSISEHHKPCMGCHDESNCSKCHSVQPKGRFEHSIDGGWALNKFHDAISCERCHGSQIKALSRDCNSCHKNWGPNSFDHKITGIKLDNNHKELDCENCHSKSTYSEAKCDNCHENMKYPRSKPGKMFKN